MLFRRRVLKQVNCTTSDDHKQQSEPDPSSSDLSADTVIYLGPVDEATDGEHPPVYLPGINSGDNRCAMGKALRGSGAEIKLSRQEFIEITHQFKYFPRSYLNY